MPPADEIQVEEPTREEFEDALDTLTTPLHPDGDRTQRRAEATIRAYVDALEEGDEYPGWDHSMDPDEYLRRYPDSEHSEAAIDALGDERAYEVLGEVAEEESDEDEGSESEEEEEDEDLQTSTGEGGSMEDVPGT